MQAKKDFEIQGKKDAKIQAKNYFEIQAKKDAKIQMYDGITLGVALEVYKT